MYIFVDTFCDDIRVVARKRDQTLEERDLDFADARHLFDGRPLYSYPSRREDEARFVSVGLLDGRCVHIRLDRDVLRWVKSHGRGYQTRINAVLRAFVHARQQADAAAKDQAISTTTGT